MSAKSWATKTSTKILATQCFDGATLGTNQTYCWSCHSTNATLGTLKPTVSSDDERVAHCGRRVQRRCGSCATLLAPMTHMNGCRWRGGRGQLLHWTSLRLVPTGAPHMLVSLFSQPYSSVSAPRCALGAEQVVLVPRFKCGTVPSCYPSPKCGGLGTVPPFSFSTREA